MSSILTFDRMLTVNVIILSPLKVIEDITTHKIDAPNIFLPAQILIHQEIFSTDTYTHPRVLLVLALAAVDLVDSVLKVVF